jgi:four helix bundle protein
MGTGFRSFEELDVYQLCCQLRREVRIETKTWPIAEVYKLTDQILRSSRSAPSQIAEGWGRFSRMDNRRFCRIGMGSLCETQDHLGTAREEEYLSIERYDQLRALCIQCQDKLKGYMKYLGEDFKNP